MKQIILCWAIVLAFCLTNVSAQKTNLVGTTWKISLCTCYGGDNEWFDGGTITFFKNGKTNRSDQKWKLVGNVIKVTTSDIYGEEFTATIKGNRMTGKWFGGMNKRETKFRAVKQ